MKLPPPLFGSTQSSLAPIYARICAVPFLAGTPDDIIEELKAVEKRYPGLERVVCATPLGTPLAVQLEDLDRFSKEVMPAFGAAKNIAAAAP